MRPEALLLAALSAAAAWAQPAPGAVENCVSSYLPKEMGEDMGIDSATWSEVCALGLSREEALKEAMRRIAARRAAPPPAPAAPAAPRPARSAAAVFDGQRDRSALVLDSLKPYASRDGKSLNLCAQRALESASLPLRFVAVVPAASCAPDAASKALADYRELSGLGNSGSDGGGALRRNLERRALGDSAYAAALGRYYELVRAAAARGAPSELAAGWAWRLALQESSGDPRTAMRLIGFCGHDDLAPGELRGPRDPGEARRVFEAEKARLLRRSEELVAGSGDAAALASNDRAADREKAAALRVESFAESREPICPEPDSVFYRPGGLTAETDGTLRSGRAPSMSHRVYAAALLACEMVRDGASPEEAAVVPVNGAWAALLLRLKAESDAYDRLRGELARDEDAYRRGLAPSERPLGSDEFSARWFRRRALTGPAGTAPSRARMDALRLLQSAAARDGWGPSRRHAAERALTALRADWERSLAQREQGARFGAKACAP